MSTFECVKGSECVFGSDGSSVCVENNRFCSKNHEHCEG